MSKITIRVTQDDIDDGGHAGNRCPIALAARRALPNLPDLHIGSTEWWPLGNVSTGRPFPLPGQAQRFVERFDEDCPEGECTQDDGRHECVAPFAFELDVPDELVPAVTR